MDIFPQLTENLFFYTTLKAAADCWDCYFLCLWLSHRKLSFCGYQGSISTAWAAGGMLPHFRSSSWMPIYSSLSDTEWKQVSFCRVLPTQNLGTWLPSWHFSSSTVNRLWSVSLPSFSLALESTVLSILLRSFSQALFYTVCNPKIFFHGNHKLKWCLVQPEYFWFWK